MFTFQQFVIHQDRCAMKVGTDGVLVGAWACGGRRILDIGTGTGVIALMMAQRFPDAEVTAIELDEDAALQARENVARSPFASRVTVVNVGLQQYRVGLFDGIVANPPFFAHALAARGDARAMARQTDSLSYRDLCQGGARLLAGDGVMSVILPADRCGELEVEASMAGLFLRKRTWVRTTEKKAPKRCLLAFGLRTDGRFQQETCVMMEGGKPTPWYQSLVGDFYLPQAGR